ncbi:GntR family transcriptional regulator [Humidisolicoccus flavus]|uniref:GntR family transcriptional regulator n=1 Tax=Humidisolicoccus flavus TaxID=3111414 RepID=UPI0032459FE0
MITVDESSAVPPFEQIRGQLTDLIRSGALAGGQRLPSIRQLAADLRVAAGTVARAYTELEGAGLIESSRSAGTRVRADQAVDDSIRRAAADFVRAAQRQDLSLEDAISVIRSQWNAS